MHNFWVEILVEGGIIGASLIATWVSCIIYKIFKISRNTKNNVIKYYTESLFLSLSSFVPAAIAASSTIYMFPMWILFGFSISVINVNNLTDFQKKSSL